MNGYYCSKRKVGLVRQLLCRNAGGCSAGGPGVEAPVMIVMVPCGIRAGGFSAGGLDARGVGCQGADILGPINWKPDDLYFKKLLICNL